MNIHHLILGALLVAACSNASSPGGESTPMAATATPSTVATTTSTATVAYAVGSKKKGDSGLCVVCHTNEGTTEEETVAEVIDYQGKTYVFCNESEKAEFISNPGKYAVK